MTQNLVYYIQAVQAALQQNNVSIEYLHRLDDQFFDMESAFNQLHANLRSRLMNTVTADISRQSIEEIVRSHIDTYAIETEGQSLAYYQELFYQLSNRTVLSSAQMEKLTTFFIRIAVFATAEMFERVDPDRALNLFNFFNSAVLFRLAYINQIPLFRGLVFSVKNARSVNFASERIATLRQDGYPDIDIEILLTEEFQGGGKYMSGLDVSSELLSDSIDRLIVFGNYYPNLVLVSSDIFWRKASKIITQEQLDELSEIQKEDIPEDSRQVIITRDLVL